MQQLVHKGGKKQMSVIETNGDSRGVLKVFQERVSNQNLLEKYSQTSRLCQTQHLHDPGEVFLSLYSLKDPFKRPCLPFLSIQPLNGVKGSTIKDTINLHKWNVSIETQDTDRQF